MIRLFLLSVLFFISTAMSAGVSTHGQLSVSNGAIVNKNKVPPQLRGMSMFWNIWGSSFYNENVMTTLSSNTGTGWNANVVRAAIGDFSVSNAKGMIDWAISKDYYIIIDNHTHCAHNQVQQSKDFFSEVSAYVQSKGNPANVIYEVYNEPVYQNCSGSTDVGSGNLTSWATIKSYAKSVIDVIRKNDPANLILVGTPNYSQGTEAARADPITGYSNVAYTLHFYASESGHNKLQLSLTKAYCNDFPVLVSEWGTSEANGNGTINTANNNLWMSHVESLKLSWVNWSVYNKNESSAALQTWAGSNGGWSDNDLSTSGKYVKNMIKNLNGGASLTSVGLAQKNIDCAAFDIDYTSPESGGIFPYGNVNPFSRYISATNVDSATNKNVYKQMALFAKNTQIEASAKYQLAEIPAAGKYFLRVSVAATGANPVMKYSIDNGQWLELALTPTKDLKTFVQSRVAVDLPDSKASLAFSWKGDYVLDFIGTYGLDSLDSLEYNLVPSSAIQNQLQPASSAQVQYHAADHSFEFTQNQFDDLSLYNMSGQLVLQAPLFNRSSYTLTSSLSNGLYKVVFRKNKQKIHLTVPIY